MDTLKQARQELEKKLIDKGGKCPCCTQFAKAYKRKITYSMAYCLIRMLNKFGTNLDFHLMEQSTVMGMGAKYTGDFPKLKYWGLIESKKSGHYQITKKGSDFVNNFLTVQKYIHIYNNKHYDTSGDFVSIIDCLNEMFNYNELMKK